MSTTTRGRLNKLAGHISGSSSSSPSSSPFTSPAAAAAADRQPSRDTSGRDANQLIAPSLDATLARAALGKVTFKGAPLAPHLVAPMRESRLADGAAVLQANLAADGYVLLRNALPAAAAAQARAEVFGRLAEVAEIHDDRAAWLDGAGIATGQSSRRAMHPDDASLSAFWRSVSEGARLRDATHGSALADAVATVLGEAATPHDYLYVRCVAPGDGKQTDLHFDHVFFGTRLQRRETLLTCWLPLTAISPVDGGIFVVENSHRFDDCLGLIEGVEAVRVEGHPSNDPPWVTDEEYLAKMKRLGRAAPSRATHMDWEDAPGFAASRGSRLLTATDAFQPGDIVLFSQWLLHGSFDGNNPDGNARLSTDLRWHATDGGGYDDRYQGDDPGGTGGGGYGELNGARPLNEGWHRR